MQTDPMGRIIDENSVELKDRDVMLKTYLKVKDFFAKNPGQEFTKTGIGQKLGIDGYGMDKILRELRDDMLIIEIRDTKTSYFKTRSNDQEERISTRATSTETKDKKKSRRK